MQYYDLVMLAIFAGAILFGAWKGLAWQVASVAAIFVSYLVALKFRGPVASLIQVQPPLNQFIAMFAIYALVSLGIWIGFGYVRSFIERFYLRSFDRQAGALLGALKGALLCIVITMFAVTLLGEARRNEICQSKSGLLIARSINQLRAVVPKEIHPVLAPYLNRFDDVMKQTNPNYALQPNFPHSTNGEGGGFGAAVREFVGEVFTTNQPASNNQIQGTVKGIAWPNQNSISAPPGNASVTPSRLPPINLNAVHNTVKDIFSPVTNTNR